MLRVLALGLTILVLAEASFNSKMSPGDIIRRLIGPGSGYSTLVLPPNFGAKNSSGVAFGVAPICLELDANGILKGSIWRRVTWDDDRLSWEKFAKDYTPNLDLEPYQIWLPDIVLYNRFEAGQPFYPSKIPGMYPLALVYKSGNVLHVPAEHVQAICSGVNRYDPWAVHSCELKYGSWVHDANEMNFTLYKNQAEADMSDYMDSCQLKIIGNTAVRESKHYDCCPEAYVSITYKLKVQRRYMITPQGMTIANPYLAGEARPTEATEEPNGEEATL